jgi:hypothetical protein
LATPDITFRSLTLSGGFSAPAGGQVLVEVYSIPATTFVTQPQSS